MEPRFETTDDRRLVGHRVTMSHADNRIAELWRGFMPRRGEIEGAVGTDLYSVEVYPPDYFDAFDPGREFEKWAAVEVTAGSEPPAGMASLTIPTGLHAVFVHRGPASGAPRTYQAIYRDWLPRSGYRLADRPHFAVMGEKYSNDGEDSEEEIWIPVVETG